MAFDYALFSQLKSKGVQPKLIDLGAGAVGLAVPQFDIQTGAPLAAAVQITNLPEIDAHIAQLQATFANIQAARDAVSAILSG